MLLGDVPRRFILAVAKTEKPFSNKAVAIYSTIVNLPFIYSSQKTI